MDERVPSPKNLLGYSFINKGKRVEGGGQERPPSSSFLSRHHTSIIGSSPGWAREFSPLVKPGLSSHYGKIISSLRTMRVFTLKCHLSINYCFLYVCVCAENMSQGSLTYGAHWAEYGSHATIVLLGWGMSHASDAQFLLLSQPAWFYGQELLS